MDGQVSFCPQCGSSAVDFSTLVGGHASCRGCGWTGPSDGLLTTPLGQDTEELARGLINDLRHILSGEFGYPYLRLLIKWGFLPCDPDRPAETIDRKVFARYLSAIAVAVMAALFDVRDKLAREEVEKRRAMKGVS